jgi:hypothetical protein
MDFLIDLPWHHQAAATKLGSCQHPSSFAMGTPPFLVDLRSFYRFKLSNFPMKVGDVKKEGGFSMLCFFTGGHVKERERNAAVNHAFRLETSMAHRNSRILKMGTYRRWTKRSNPIIQSLAPGPQISILRFGCVAGAGGQNNQTFNTKQCI